MIRLTFILAGMTALQSAAWAQTRTPCDAIDEIYYSAFLVKKMQSAPSGSVYDNTAAALNTIAAKISLPAVVIGQEGGQMGKGLETERAALFQYVSRIREGASAAQAGFEDYAQEVLSAAVTAEFTQSLNSLETYWNCSPAPLAAEADIDTAQAAARFNGGTLADEEAADITLASTAVGTTKTARRFSGGGSTLPKAQLDSIMPRASVSLFALLAGLGLVIGMMYARAHSKKSRAREKRRLLNLMVPIKLGPSRYEAGLVDISMNGLKLQHGGTIKRPGKLFIELEGQWYLGQIKWHNHLFAGVKFKKPIDESLLKSVIDASQ